jgi:hypothetical protein
LNVSTRTGTAIGSGLGATAGGLATGQSLQNALLGGLASGASSYFLPGVADELGLTTPSTPSSSTGSGSGTFDGNAINVTGGTSAIGTPVSISDGGGSAPRGDTGQDTLNDASQNAPAEGLINVTGARVPPLSLPASIFTGQPQATEPVSTDPADGGLIDVIAPRQPSLPIPVPAQGPAQGPSPLDTLGFTGAEMQPETLPENEIVVSGANAPSLPAYVPVSTPNIEAPGALGLTGAQLAPTQPEPTQPENEIVVSGANAPSLSPYVPAPGLTGSRPNMGFTGARDGATQPEAPPENNTLQDIIDYLRLAGLATSTLGGLVGGGGGGGGSNFRVPGGMGALSPVFGSQLPPPNLPGGVGGVGGGGTGGRTAADLAGQGLSSPIDYYRYGYGPEQSFFNYAPQGAPNTSQAYTGYARGGFAVEGAGDGRDDKIPALLSDGEYVIDAETVALLGNGSNKAGAKMLDKFRVNVRKQKGRKLARGEFSAKAKRPEHYLAGGRT